MKQKWKAGDQITEVEAKALNTIRLWFSAMRATHPALSRVARELLRERLEKEPRHV